MDKIQVTDEMLYRYMPGLEEKLLNALPEEEEIRVKFTEEFNQRMEVLMRRAKQKERYGIPVTTWRRMAAALAVIIAGSMAATMSVEANREKLYEFIRKVYETYAETHYSSEGDKVGKFVPLYPKYIPEGYELVIKEEYDDILFLSYENKDGVHSITIRQDQVINGMVVADDNEYIKEEPCIVRDQKGRICYKENGIIRVLWETSNTLHVVSGKDISKEELLKVCESLEEK